jgi:hypothetical protein|tara:strand:- start:171 stop:338 length:168 start_codon:yes stop_codon:yes gene_type:complete
MKINLDFIQSDKECDDCDYHNHYACFNHEYEQVKEKYNNAYYTEECVWVKIIKKD